MHAAQPLKRRLWGALAVTLGGALVLLLVGSRRPGEVRRATVDETLRARPEEKRITAVERLGVRIEAVYPHDPEAYTQGLLWRDGELWESTGLNGRSSLRRVDLESGTVLQEVHLPWEIFAEGLAAVGDQLIQLSWKNGLAFRWSRGDLAKLGEHRYAGEGWGLAFDGAYLVMSNGSARLTFRDPRSFAVRRELEVQLEGAPLDRLNELECVAGAIYANVWTEDRIVRIDPSDGRVDAVIDAHGLLSSSELGSAEVLNGIAYRSDRQTFLLTGKLWPWLFEVTWR